VLTRVISFLLLAVCGALCQSKGPSANVPPGLSSEGSNVPRGPHQPQISFPDAPSVNPPSQWEKFYAFIEEAGSPLTFGAVAVNAGVMRGEEQHLAPGIRPSLSGLYRTALFQKESSTFFGKYLYPSLLRQDPRYHASTSDSVLGRASYAASRILITRNDSGKKTLNTSYFLGVLTSMAITTAYRPYWARSSSTTFKGLGATIGNDVGINVFHEFWPGIRQMVKGHAPKFVQRIEEHLPDILARRRKREASERKRPRTAQGFCVPKADLVAQGYDLSLTS